MTKEEILYLFKQRYLNSKTNNYIFTNNSNFDILKEIDNKCSISTFENDINIDFAENIKINLNEIDVKDILSYTLNLLKEKSLVDIYFDYTLNFNNKLDLLKFQQVLYSYNKIVQLIFYNLNEMSLQDQMLFNELYYFNSIFFNINSFIKENDFKTYSLNRKKILDNRENYMKIKINN